MSPGPLSGLKNLRRLKNPGDCHFASTPPHSLTDFYETGGDYGLKVWWGDLRIVINEARGVKKWKKKVGGKLMGERK